MTVETVPPTIIFIYTSTRGTNKPYHAQSNTSDTSFVHSVLSVPYTWPCVDRVYPNLSLYIFACLEVCAVGRPFFGQQQRNQRGVHDGYEGPSTHWRGVIPRRVSLSQMLCMCIYICIYVHMCVCVSPRLITSMFVFGRNKNWVVD